jgi:hypothetical protein
LAKAGTCFGTCLELSTFDNQIVNRENGTKVGKCLGILKIN